MKSTTAQTGSPSPRRPSSSSPPVPLPAEERARFLGLRHKDPHHLLGWHPQGGRAVVRAYRPDAAQVVVLFDDGGRELLHPVGDGLFEASLSSSAAPGSYRLEATYPDGLVHTARDPYTFAPTLGELDLHLAGEGRHERLWEKLGAHVQHHQGQSGVAFAVWAPTADGVSVVGDFNGWDGRLHPMRMLGASGIWELFVPDLNEGVRYKFEVRPQGGGPRLLKADPFAFRTEVPPLTASVVHSPGQYRWGDGEWMGRRAQTQPRTRPVSIYELHATSWRHVVEHGVARPMTYRELAPALADYVQEMGFTHVELLPLAEHPFGGSWGYQVSAYYAPTSRLGHPDDLRFLIDTLHQRGIGVILDWVPAHFPRDAFALARFDGTALYEHEDPRRGAHPDWGTLIFNFGRNEVRNFLVANALFWLEEYHLDGLRVDAVASMLYLDYSRPAGEWVPNRFGGRENDEAISFLRELNDTVRKAQPGAMVIAEESTAWPQVTGAPAQGGLGFEFKWNMGWMHDTLSYFSKDPVYRKHHHHQLTFGLLYAFSEHFVLPLSHDEVVHGKGALLDKMPGDAWQKRANLRALFAWMWAHPGKKLLFMGGELGQWREWNHDISLDWHLLESPDHRGVQALVRALNEQYRREAALWERDPSAEGFQWVQADTSDDNVYAFLRHGELGHRPLLCVANLSPVPRPGFRVGCPAGAERFVELLNTDAAEFGGSGVGNFGHVRVDGIAWNGQPASLELTLPPLGVLWLAPE